MSPEPVRITSAKAQLMEEMARRAREELVEEWEEQRQNCTCICHQMDGVKHVAACC